MAAAAAIVLCTANASAEQANQAELLPPYRPQQMVAGTIRNFGFGFGGLLKLWEEGFRRYQPAVTFDDKLPTSDAAFPALVTGVTDLAPDGGEPALTETLSFFETHGYHATSIMVASGSYDVDGRSPGIVVLVHHDNPIVNLTLNELDGIFGAQRTGALHGFRWSVKDARGAKQDVRAWGQLGFTGEWADKPIQTYGHAPSGTARFFQLMVLHNSDKWNPNYREYVETGSKMVADDDHDQIGGLEHMLRDELAHDRYGIAFTTLPQARRSPGAKMLALAAQEGGPYVLPSRESFANRTYPLVRSLYIYLNRKPGMALDPKLKGFLSYVLSREGQVAVIDNGGYLPLPVDVVHEQRAKLE